VTERTAEYNRQAVVRLAVACGAVLLGMLLVGLLPQAARSSMAGSSMPEGWQTLLGETFDEGLSAGWTVTDTSTADGGEYTWGTTTFTYTSPITAVWSVGGGADGSGLVAGTDTYTDNVDSWLIYGPVTLTDVFHADFAFDWWLDSAPGDWFGWCVTTDIGDLSAGCDEARISGPIGAWISGTASIESYAFTSTPIYLAFHFTSNDDGQTGRGVFIDNVTVRGDYGQHTFLPLVRRDATPTPAFWVDEFDDPSSGWWTGSAWRNNDEVCPGYQEVAKVSYHYTGHYRIFVKTDCRVGGSVNSWFVRPALAAPLGGPTVENYNIEARGKIANSPPSEPYQPWWAYWGIVFGGNDSFTNIYTFRVDIQKHFMVSRFAPYQWPGNRVESQVQPRTGEIQEIRNGPEYNTLRVEVRKNKATFFVNGRNLGTVHISELSSLHKIGLIGGDVEVTPVDVLIDYFRYEPLP